MNRHTILRGACAAGMLAFGLAGCGGLRASHDTTEAYEATMSGAQEVPPVATAGNGRAEAQFNPQTHVLTWKVTYSGLSGPATAGHFHGPAEAGRNAGVVVPFSNVASQPITGQATLTPAQVADLVAGRWYANVHTAAHPGGEIRGQLRRRQ